MTDLLDLSDRAGDGATDEYRVSFSRVYASQADPDLFDTIILGSGQTVAQAAGVLNIASGTTTNAETIIRSKRAFTGDFIFRYAALLSQRIANQTFFIELVDVLGDNLQYTINSTTSVTVILPNTTITDAQIGQSVYLGAITGAAGIPGRYAISAVNGNQITFTVASWPASGSGTLSLFGMNHHHVAYDGTTATNAKYDAQRRGWNSGDTTATINTTASPGHIGVIASVNGASAYLDQVTTSATGAELSQRASRTLNVPTNDVKFYIQLRVVNGTSAPASTTTFTLNFLAMIPHDAPAVSISGIMPFSQNFVLPIQVQNAPTVNLGAGGTSAISLGKAEDAAHTSGDTGVAILGVRVPTTPTAKTSATGDYGAIALDQEGKQVQSPYAAMEQSWQTNPITLTTTTSTALKAAAAAGVRNYLTDIDIANTSATGVRVDVLDNATVIRSFWVPPTSTITKSFNMPIRGTAATAMNVQLSAAVTDVRVSANGYIGI